MTHEPSTNDVSKRIEQNFQKVNDAFRDIGKNMTEEEVEQFAREAIKYTRNQILNKHTTDEK
jgi:hypothetical protein